MELVSVRDSLVVVVRQSLNRLLRIAAARSDPAEAALSRDSRYKGKCLRSTYDRHSQPCFQKYSYYETSQVRGKNQSFRPLCT